MDGEKLILNIAKEFTTTPGARYYSDGPFSGEAFYDEVLKLKYEKAINENKKLIIILDGTRGFASSFQSEAFGRLYMNFGGEVIWNNIEFISNDNKFLIESIKYNASEYEISQSDKTQS